MATYHNVELKNKENQASGILKYLFDVFTDSIWSHFTRVSL